MSKALIKDSKYQGDSERGRLAIKSHLLTFPKASTAAITVDIEMANLGSGSVSITIDLTTATVDFIANLEVGNDGVNYTGIARKELDDNEIASGNTTLAKGSVYNHIVSYADYHLVMAMRFLKLTLTPDTGGPTPVTGDIIPVHVVQK